MTDRDTTEATMGGPDAATEHGMVQTVQEDAIALEDTTRQKIPLLQFLAVATVWFVAGLATAAAGYALFVTDAQQRRAERLDAALRAQSSKREDEIKAFQAQIASSESRINALQSQLKEYLAENNSLRGELQAARARLLGSIPATGPAFQTSTFLVGKQVVSQNGCCTLTVVATDPDRNTAYVSVEMFKRKWQGTLVAKMRQYVKSEDTPDFWFDLQTVRSKSVTLTVSFAKP